MKIDKAELLHVDCMEYMTGLPDKVFDLAIVDPPYGIGISKNPVRQLHEKKQWDCSIPDEDYYKAACQRVQRATEQMRLFA